MLVVVDKRGSVSRKIPSSLSRYAWVRKLCACPRLLLRHRAEMREYPHNCAKPGELVLHEALLPPELALPFL